VSRFFILCVALTSMGITIKGAAEQQDMSANYWLPRCKTFLNSPSNNVNGHFCAGLLQGMGYVATGATRLCVPDGVTREQAMRVVVNHIEAQPKRMHEKFWQLALEALHDAWPLQVAPHN
jgi:hypothetical protein